MSIETARSTIIRKFTNHRNYELGVESTNGAKQVQALKDAAVALVDFKAFSKGKARFKKQNISHIMKRRDELYKESLKHDDKSLHLPLIVAFQKALKELWNNADHEHWEMQAADDAEDIYS